MRDDYVLKLLEKDERLDGRKLDEFRPIEIKTGFIEKAEGSTRVKIGKTDVIVGVKMDVGEPYPDIPDTGTLKTEAEFSPIAHGEFEPGPPREDATELARVVDRGIRESESIDLEKLCIKKGEKVWTVFVDIYTINHDGNLIDASALGAIAALSTAKMPELKDDKIVRDKFVKKLPMLHKPITVTVGKIMNKFIIDPTEKEEKFLGCKLSVAVREDGKICAMQKIGNEVLTEEDVDKMIKLVVKKSEEIRKLI